MSHLVAIAYPDQRRALEVIEALGRLDAESAIELEDVVAVSKDNEGGIKLLPTRLLEPPLARCGVR